MIKNYLKVAFRNFSKNKIFSLINILSLSIGISASVVIFLIVQYNYSFDKFEKNGNRIFRIVSEYSMQGNPGHSRGVPATLADAVKKEVSGIDEITSFRYYNVGKIAIQSTNPAKPSLFKYQQNIIFADGHYFEMLPYKWLAGSPQSALNEPGHVVLSASRAKLYFPALHYTDVVGRRIVYDDSLTIQVSGVVEDLDKQGPTDFTFKEFISLPTILENKGLRDMYGWDNWGSTASDQELYVRLGNGNSASAIENRLKAIFNKYQGESAKKNSFTWAYLLQPLNDIHFNSDYGIFNMPVANKSTLYGLILVATFLLLLGSINFINLATAQASQRAKEIGIRKAMGSSKRQLVFQFLSETFLVTLLATVLSVVLTPLLLKVFASFIPSGLEFSLAQPALTGFLAFLILTVSFLAGFYPAMVLSSLNALQVLKNNTSSTTGSTRRTWIRQSLTVSQFIIAQFFVIGTVLVSKQIHYMLNKDLGFSKDAIFSFVTPSSDTSYAKRLFLLNKISRIPGIALTSLSSDVPASGSTTTSLMQFRPDGKNEIENDVEVKFGDTNYLKLFHIPLLAGRNILSCDTVKELVINETYLHLMGFKYPVEAIGKSANLDYYTPIVGVMKDFHAHPLNMDIKPMVYSFSSKYCKTIVVALRHGEKFADKWTDVIAGIEKTYNSVYPGEDFSYYFLDQRVADFYQSEEQTAGLLRWTTGLTILISCLGLLGLVIYTTNNRRKEIGVRKVLGASVTQIVSILSTDFLKLVIWAFLIATPLSWWAIHKWLDNFAFRTSISWWVFLVSGLGMAVIALLTLSVQTIRAAKANPVKSLRTE